MFLKGKNSNLELVHKFGGPPYTLDVRETRGRFVLMSNRDKIIDVRYVLTETQSANIFTKGLDAAYLETLISLAS